MKMSNNQLDCYFMDLMYTLGTKHQVSIADGAYEDFMSLFEDFINDDPPGKLWMVLSSNLVDNIDI